MAQTKINKTVGKIFTGLHRRIYKLSGGRIGGSMQGGDIIVLGHKGAKSGKQRETPLIGGQHDDGWVVIASYSGHDEHPAWYHNLVANPDATVQLGKQTHRVRAREVEGDEREQLWNDMAQIYSDYDEYKSVTERHIPVLVLERV